MPEPFSIADLQPGQGPENLLPAERALLAAAAAGQLCKLGEVVPDPADPAAPRIRAGFLQHLITGGSAAAPVAAAGVRLMGAVIDGPLSLAFMTAQGETDLRACHFTDGIILRRSQLEQLVLTGSHFPSLLAEGSRIEGSVFLIGVTCPGRISFATAQIGAQLALHAARVGPVTAQGAKIGASVHLRALDGHPFAATGEVSLAGAEIGGQLACDGGHFVNPGKIAFNLQRARVAGDAILRQQGELPFRCEGELHLSGAEIDGQLDLAGAELANPGGHAISAPRMQVGAEFFWHDVKVESGTVNLPSAHVGDLVDDLASWPGDGRTYIDGFTYERITRKAPVDAASRIAWLKRCATHERTFLPQPYTQCAAVLAHMGHEAEARLIMEEQSRRKGIARRDSRLAAGGILAWPITVFDWLWDHAAHLIVGYGYRPFRSIVWLAVLTLLTAGLAQMAWTEGSMAPNNDLVASSPGWQELLARDCLPTPTPGCVANPAEVWNGVEGAGFDWESFHPLAYGADIVIPVFDLGQKASWSPSKDRGPWGHTLWWARWFLVAAGWVVTALGAAAATGIIQRGVPT
jgi:hypothetical protein